MTIKNKSMFSMSGNTLKIIASLSMLIDHMGFILFPDIKFFRIIGRLAFPIFAFMIAEGCKYTKNKLRYFFTIFLLAIICEIAYYLYTGKLYMCILVTFSFSILIIYALQNFKNNLFNQKKSIGTILLSGLLLIMSVTATYIFNQHLRVDYGFIGCMIPVLASLFHQIKKNSPKILTKLDCVPVQVFLLAVGLVILAFEFGGFQIYSLLALFFLLCYSGSRGNLNLKYFFYLFYPLHLLLLEVVSLLLN